MKLSDFLTEEYKTPAPFTDASKEDIMKMISKPAFVKKAGTIFKVVNPRTFKGYKLTGAAVFLAKEKTQRASYHIDKDVILLHAAVYFKSPPSKDGHSGGNSAALLVTCHSQDGKLWVKDEIITSDGYFTKNPLEKDKSLQLLKCFLASGEEVASIYKLENSH